jgi:hypothetical protein
MWCIITGEELMVVVVPVLLFLLCTDNCLPSGEDCVVISSYFSACTCVIGFTLPAAVATATYDNFVIGGVESKHCPVLLLSPANNNPPLANGASSSLLVGGGTPSLSEHTTLALEIAL